MCLYAAFLLRRQYDIAPIPWIGFCPIGSVAPPKPVVTAVANATVCFASINTPVTASVTTTYPNPWVQFPNWACTNINGLVQCNGQLPTTGACVSAQVREVLLVVNDVI